MAGCGCGRRTDANAAKANNARRNMLSATADPPDRPWLAVLDLPLERLFRHRPDVKPQALPSRLIITVHGRRPSGRRRPDGVVVQRRQRGIIYLSAPTNGFIFHRIVVEISLQSLPAFRLQRRAPESRATGHAPRRLGIVRMTLPLKSVSFTGLPSASLSTKSSLAAFGFDRTRHPAPPRPPPPPTPASVSQRCAWSSTPFLIVISP